MTSQSNTIISDKVRVDLDTLIGLYRQRSHSQTSSELIEKVYDYVVNNICSGKWPPGQKISEIKIASGTGLSRIPVREAMELLWQRGWIDRIPNRGAFVKKYDIAEVEHLFQFREILETGAVRLTAKSITTEQLSELKTIMDLLHSAQKSNKEDLRMRADDHFHRLLVHFAGNPRIEMIFESILLQARGFFFVSSLRLPFYANSVHKFLIKADHAHIYEALLVHDVEKAEKLIREHIRIGRESTINMMKLINESKAD